MTYSVIAAEPATGRIGTAIASRFLAVGSYCVYAGPTGAVVSQGLANPVLGVHGLAALADGGEPESVLARLLASDPHAEHRQVHLMDAAGAHAACTGNACTGWAGSVSGECVSLAGNMLAGEHVLDAMRTAWAASAERPMAERLLEMLGAGEGAGGDWRGQQAAAVQVFHGEIYPELDLRVDDCDGSPVDELRRLYRRHLAADVQAFRGTLPRGTTGPEPEYPGIGDLAAVHSKNPAGS